MDKVYTDAELIAALDLGVAAGEFVTLDDAIMAEAIRKGIEEGVFVVFDPSKI